VKGAVVIELLSTERSKSHSLRITVETEHQTHSWQHIWPPGALCQLHVFATGLTENSEYSCSKSCHFLNLLPPTAWETAEWGLKMQH
jgi:hypothetical protein